MNTSDVLVVKTMSRFGDAGVAHFN